MTVITVKLTKATETFDLDPTLPPAKEMQVVAYFGTPQNIAIFCDIVDPLSSYSNYEKDEFGPSRLLAVVPSQEYPTVKARKTQDPMDSIKFDLLDVSKNPPKVDESQPMFICLKIYHRKGNDV